jgi:hypothetical protein
MPLLLMGRDAHATGEQANGLAPNTPPALQHSSTPVPLRCVKVRGRNAFKNRDIDPTEYPDAHSE